MAITYKLEVSKKGADKKYVPVGTVDVPVFELSDFGLEVTPSSYDKETGFPVYDNPKVQYVFDSIFAATKAAARNKLLPETATVKPGLSIATTVDELIAKADSGAALALFREFTSAFETYLRTKSGKKDAVQAIYLAMAKNRNSIVLATQAKKDGFATQLAAFAEQATAEEMDKFASILETLAGLATEGAELDDSDL